ncbi:endochitinase A-like [Sinocyclocheilus anshuiensis]|uniref:endochitinase A-like n=1 Tax=Sinocyclocheilus anshuiensis TaxID=1608454 RepID=UPI0007B9C864|nr:PREDICTED: endochitinase A-like [Sinocyclocheilus anshuiensis]
MYLKIEKCPVQLRGQMSLFGGTQTCSCGFHTTKPSRSVSSSMTPGPSSASLVASLAATPGQTATSGRLTPHKPTLTMASPISCTSDSSAMSSTVISAMTRRTPSPACSPRMYIQTVSTLSLPPSPVSTTTSSIPSVAARAVRNS